MNFNTTGTSALDAGDGGILLVTPNGDNGSMDYPYMVKFDAQGDWVWARTINYASNAPYQKSQAAAFASNGDILIYVVVSTPGGQSLIHRLNSNGILQRSDLYSDHQWSEAPISIYGLSSGNHFVVKPNGRLLHLSEDGTPIALYDHIPTALADQTYSPGVKNSMVQGNSLSLFGSFTGVHQIFGTIGSWPMDERFDLSGPIEGCNVSDIPVQQYPVPANIITVADQNPPPTLDISGSTELSTTAWTTTDLSGLSPLNLCVFIEELGVGMDEAIGTSTAPMLRTNCVLTDGRVDAVIPAAGMLEWRDSLGRLLAAQRVSANGPTSLQAPSIAGHYLLTWTAADGSDRRSERLMVQ
ncbi:MAG: hypothetical protein IPM46_03750 [Flavobacteriales bacterium]|nr:hypothetical protein [Flavobacteriales bacterium]